MPNDLSPQEREEHDRANSELGARFVRALAAEKAINDKRLDPASLRVFGAILYHMNSASQRAWPGYRKIGEITGYSDVAIERSIRQLKAAGYIFAQRRAPVSGGRAIVHYGLQRVRPSDIDEIVTAAVTEYRRTLTRSKQPPPLAPRCHLKEDADPAQIDRVGEALTRQVLIGSASDPTNFQAVDPTGSGRQEPNEFEPKVKYWDSNGDANCGFVEDQPLDGEVHRLSSRGRAARRERLDPTKHMTEEWVRIAVDLGVPADCVNREAEQFIDHHAAKGSSMADWTAAWRTWCRNAKRFATQGFGACPRPSQSAWRHA